MNNQFSEELLRLYTAKSKHSAYQQLPESLLSIMGYPRLEVVRRYEKERFEFILESFSLAHSSILDIGGNTGYFTISAIEHGADHVDYYEGNDNHANFVYIASLALGIAEKIKINKQYFGFKLNAVDQKQYDICFCLNVLHHLGDDFGCQSIGLSNAKTKMIESLDNLAYYVNVIFFQMGFNWKGDRNIPIFENGTKKEMIQFIADGVSDKWEIVDIAIPENVNGKIKYKKASSENIERNDKLGEFLNRPIFVLKSKVISER
ncbi:class I SAM-dependent methyltransferase [Methanosarcina barkeri]|uniref:SAM-dependent methyltransferase n=1 Tax=Methanosarcina barkeri CM1 TaxID=796385 RepID=A0A0G3CA64_METBA|nr:class I SAM-dependent methyltransferase [Methanosarcina barkeri]AKJ38886.1 SAM-dependent methyltransferase [Methanosarcina barkeri CM1]